jgi:hypothetical protein
MTLMVRMTRHDCPHIAASQVFVMRWARIDGHEVQIALCPACQTERGPVAVDVATR